VGDAAAAGDPDADGEGEAAVAARLAKAGVVERAMIAEATAQKERIFFIWVFRLDVSTI
jgi:hypothetical protein